MFNLISVMNNKFWQHFVPCYKYYSVMKNNKTENNSYFLMHEINAREAEIESAQ